MSEVSTNINSLQVTERNQSKLQNKGSELIPISENLSDFNFNKSQVNAKANNSGIAKSNLSFLQNNESSSSLTKFKQKTQEEKKDEEEKEQFYKQREEKIQKKDKINHQITSGGLAIRNINKAINAKINVKKFIKSFNAVFDRRHQETFSALNSQIDETLQNLDRKMLDTLSKKQYEMLHSFQTSIAKMAKELKETQDKYKELEEILLNDKRLQALEKHLIFFRDQCKELKENQEKADYDYKVLLAQYEQEKNEKEINRCALLRVEEESQSLKSLLENKQQTINKMNQFIVNSHNQQHQQDINIQSNQQLNNSNNYEKPFYMTQPQINSGRKNNNFIIKAQPNTSRQSSYLLNPDDFINEDGEDFENQEQNYFEQQSLLLHQKIQQNYINSGGAHQLEIIKEFFKKIQSQQAKKMEHLKAQQELNQQKIQELNYQNTISEDMAQQNDLKSLFLQCLKDTKSIIYQRNLQKAKSDEYENQRVSTSEGKFTKFDSFVLIEKFMSSKRFLQILQAKIFNEKCCDNQNCKYNMKNEDYFQEKMNFDIYQTKNLNSRLATILQSSKQDFSYINSSSNNKGGSGSGNKNSKIRSSTVYGTQLPGFISQRQNSQDASNRNEHLQQFYNQQLHEQKHLIKKRERDQLKERQEKDKQIQSNQVKNQEFYRKEKLYAKKLEQKVDTMLHEFSNAAAQQKLKNQKF